MRNDLGELIEFLRYAAQFSDYKSMQSPPGRGWVFWTMVAILMACAIVGAGLLLLEWILERAAA